MRGALLLVGDKIHTRKAGDLAFKIAIVDGRLEAVLLAGRPVVIHASTGVLREVTIRRGRAGVLRRAELRERRAPVALLDLGENGAGVARGGQDFDGLAVDIRAEISGGQRVGRGNERRVLRDLRTVVFGDKATEFRRGNPQRRKSLIQGSHL